MNYYASYSKVVVLGAGVSGIGAAILAKQEGYEVFLSDAGALTEHNKAYCANYDIDYEELKHTESIILNADVIIKSPGIPNKVDIIQKIKAKGIKIISEIEFAFQHTKAKTVAITGSNGKTTTSLLTHHILKSAGLNAGLVGNIGESFALAVASNPYDVYVIEVSSFQLEDLEFFKPNISVLTNLSPDHLDRYNYSMDEYASAKINIAKNQDKGDHFIYCIDDEESVHQLQGHTLNTTTVPISIQQPLTQGGFVEGGHIHIQLNTQTFMMSIGELSLKGRHNLYNSLAASVAAKVLEVENYSLKQSLHTFKNAAHRLEFVAKVRGVEFINDSKATNVNSTWYALECQSNKVVLILGGVDKGNDYNMLKDLAKDKVKAIVCLGTSNEKIISAFKGLIPTIIETDNAVDAVKTAYALAEPGESVLLSPACASFDLFKNYEDRGDQFSNAVRNL